MRIAVDIDGTLCWSNLPIFLQECNRTFDLKIDQSMLGTITTKEAFYELPEVMAVQAQNEYFKDELAWIEYREKCILESLLMDDAVKGITKLSTLGDIEYYTARFSSDHDIQAEIELSTVRWLENHDFINNSKVIFCDGIQDKLQQLLKVANSNTILLVDDSFRSIIKEIELLEQSEQAILCEKLVIIAMRAKEYDLPSTDLKLKMISLPCWNGIDKIIERIHQHELGHVCYTEATGRSASTDQATGPFNDRKGQ